MADEAAATAVDQSTADDGAKDATTTTTPDTAKGDESALGDPGKRALDAMKAERNAAKSELANLRAELDALKAKAEGREAEHAAEREAQKVRDAALAVANARILKAEIRAAAAGKLTDPADALRFVDASGFAVGEDGEVDSAAVQAAIADLLKERPYLGVKDARFQAGADGGARNEQTAGQLSQEDVKRLYAERKYDEIEKARAEGRLNSILGAK